MRWGVGQPASAILAIESNWLILRCRFASFLLLWSWFSGHVEDRFRVRSDSFEGLKGDCQRTELSPNADEAIERKTSVYL